MRFDKLLHSEVGKILVSIILGLGLATLFRRVCSGKNCLNFVGPEYKELKERTYRYNDDCIAFKEHAVTCDKSKKVLPFS